MATNPDTITVTVCTEVVVSDKVWRATMRAKGIDMAGKVTAAHVAATVRKATLDSVAALGFPQQPTIEGKRK